MPFAKCLKGHAAFDQPAGDGEVRQTTEMVIWRWILGSKKIEKIENFEKLPNDPESIGEVFGGCLGVFSRTLEHLASPVEF